MITQDAINEIPQEFQAINPEMLEDDPLLQSAADEQDAEILASIDAEDRYRNETLSFVSMLDIKARLSGSGYRLVLALDRFACPMPGNEKSMKQFVSSVKDIQQWASQMTQADQKIMSDMVTNHVKSAMPYVKAHAEMQKSKTE